MPTTTSSGQGQATAWYDPNNWSGTIDTLHLAGLATGAAFTLQHAAGTSTISLHG